MGLCYLFNSFKAKRKKEVHAISNFVEKTEDNELKIKINVDTIIRNKFFKGYNRSKPVTWMVIHGTGGKGTLRWMRDLVKFKSRRGLRYQKGIGLFHYLIETDGTIWNIIDPNKWVWHASIGQYDGGTIGVELENTHRANRNPYSEMQYNSLLALYNHLRFNGYPKMKTMISHNRAKIKINHGRLGGKECPGKGFDWIMWKNMVREHYDFAHNNGESLWDINPT